MGLFHCVGSGCTEVRYQPYKKVGGIKYRYRSEDWITIPEGDDFEINDNRRGQCTGNYRYSIEFDCQTVRPNGSPSYNSNWRHSIYFRVGQKILNPSSPIYFDGLYPTGVERYKEAYADGVTLTGDRITNRSAANVNNEGFLPSTLTNVEIVLYYRPNRYKEIELDSKYDNCGKCEFKAFSNGNVICTESRNECPEVIVSNSDDYKLSDRTKVVQIEKLPFLERVDVVPWATHQPQIQFDIEELEGQQYGFGILLDDMAVSAVLDLNNFDPTGTETTDIDFDVNISYLFNLLNMAITINGVTKSDTVYIDADVINRFGGGGGGINIGGDDVGCQQIADALQLELAEILAAIAAVQAQVTQVKEVVTVEVEGQVLAKFDCPKPDPDSGEETNAAQVEDYKLATLPALHEQLKFINQNQLAMFERICEADSVLAFPDCGRSDWVATFPR